MNQLRTKTAVLLKIRSIRYLPCISCLFFLLFFAGGCASVGRTFPVTPIADIRIGATTQQEIRTMFGEPWRVGIDDGKKTWTYGKYKYRLFGQSDTQDLILRFDDNGVVVSYTYNTTEHQE